MASGYSPSNVEAIDDPVPIIPVSGHNEYVKALLNMGVLGLTALLIAGYACLRYSWLLFTRARDHFNRSIGLGMIGATSAFIIVAVTQPGILHAQVGAFRATIYLWVFLGVVLALLKMEEVASRNTEKANAAQLQNSIRRMF